jgi:lipopolysaccharide export system permease protein
MSFTISPVLSRYIGKRFISAFALVYSGLLVMIFLIDGIELIGNLAKYNNLTISRVLVMTSLRLPRTGLDLMPFAILIAAVYTFWRLTRTSELIIVRATGVSAWQFLCAPIIIGLALAVLKMGVLNPIGAVMLSRYEHMESRYLTRNEEVINISTSGLWLRQRISENQIAIIHATNIKLPEWKMNPVTAFFFDKNNKQTHRIDSDSAQLQEGEWIFNDAWVNATQQNNEVSEPAYYEVLKLPTAITSSDIMSRFASPSTIAFWRLPDYARIMQSTGFESNPLWARFYTLLAEPLLNTALIIIAAALSLRAPRMQKNWWLVLSTIAIGFSIFFMGDFLEALGISDKLPLMFAAFVPATISLFMGLTALLYLEDG